MCDGSVNLTRKIWALSDHHLFARVSCSSFSPPSSSSSYLSPHNQLLSQIQHLNPSHQESYLGPNWGLSLFLRVRYWDKHGLLDNVFIYISTCLFQPCSWPRTYLAKSQRSQIQGMAPPPTILRQSSPMIPHHMKPQHMRLHHMRHQQPPMELPQAPMGLHPMSLCHRTNQLQVMDSLVGH